MGYDDIKEEIARLLTMDDGMDIEIQLVRPMGNPVILYSFEKDNISICNDYIEFYENNRKRKVLYKNIVQIKWRTLFFHKPVKEVTDGEYSIKRSVSADGQPKNNDKSDDDN